MRAFKQHAVPGIVVATCQHWCVCAASSGQRNMMEAAVATDKLLRSEVELSIPHSRVTFTNVIGTGPPADGGSGTATVAAAGAGGGVGAGSGTCGLDALPPDASAVCSCPSVATMCVHEDMSGKWTYGVAGSVWGSAPLMAAFFADSDFFDHARAFCCGHGEGVVELGSGTGYGMLGCASCER